MTNRLRTTTDEAGPAERLADAMAALSAAAKRHGVHLRVLACDELPAFAVAVHRAEALAHPGSSGSRDGVAPRRPAGVPLGAGDDRGAVYAILFTDRDEQRDRLAAGEALSDVWPTFTTYGLAASPIDAVVETPSTREVLRRLLRGSGHPAIAIRIGVPAGPWRWA